MKKIVFILSLLVLGISSCKKEPQSTKTQAEFIAELENSPDTIGIGTHVFVLHAELIRNFMPVCEENGDPMYGVVHLTDISGNTEQNTAILKRHYTIQNNELWSNTITSATSSEPNTVSGVSYGGPKWQSGTQADVVCEFEFQGVTKRIIVKSQTVQAVY